MITENTVLCGSHFFSAQMRGFGYKKAYDLNNKKSRIGQRRHRAITRFYNDAVASHGHLKSFESALVRAVYYGVLGIGVDEEGVCSFVSEKSLMASLERDHAFVHETLLQSGVEINLCPTSAPTLVIFTGARSSNRIGRSRWQGMNFGDVISYEKSLFLAKTMDPPYEKHIVSTNDVKTAVGMLKDVKVSDPDFDILMDEMFNLMITFLDVEQHKLFPNVWLNVTGSYYGPLQLSIRNAEVMFERYDLPFDRLRYMSSFKSLTSHPVNDLVVGGMLIWDNYKVYKRQFGGNVADYVKVAYLYHNQGSNGAKSFLNGEPLMYAEQSDKALTYFESIKV